MGTYYKNVEKFLSKIDTNNWLEIGVDRGEGSTRWFADLAGQRGVKFFGVDADAEQIQRATESMKIGGQAIIGTDGSISRVQQDMPAHVQFFHARGEEFLDLPEIREQKFALAYLDNFDWDYWLGCEEEAFVPACKQHYREVFGIEMTNINSQLTHLLQAVKLVPMMTANSIIVCDDTWYHPQEGIFIGKCSAAIPYLLLHGYRVLHGDGYRQNSGVILGRGSLLT